MDDKELRKRLEEWVTAYKDAAERNALAENPEESADYLLTLFPNEAIRKDERKKIADILDSSCPEYGEEIYKCPRCVRQLRDKLRRD